MSNYISQSAEHLSAASWTESVIQIFVIFDSIEGQQHLDQSHEEIPEGQRLSEYGGLAVRRRLKHICDDAGLHKSLKYFRNIPLASTGSARFVSQDGARWSTNRVIHMDR